MMTSSPSTAPACTGRTCARGLALLVFRDHEHVIAARALAQGTHRHGDGRPRGARREPERARMRQARSSRAVHRFARAPSRCACSDRRARRWRESSRRSARIAARRRRRDRPCADCCGDPLRDREVHVSGVIHALKRGELRALVQVLARVHVRMPTRARNGARIVLRSMIARVRCHLRHARRRARHARWSSSMAEAARCSIMLCKRVRALSARCA